MVLLHYLPHYSKHCLEMHQSLSLRIIFPATESYAERLQLAALPERSQSLTDLCSTYVTRISRTINTGYTGLFQHANQLTTTVAGYQIDILSRQRRVYLANHQSTLIYNHRKFQAVFSIFLYSTTVIYFYMVFFSNFQV